MSPWEVIDSDSDKDGAIEGDTENRSGFGDGQVVRGIIIVGVGALEGALLLIEGVLDGPIDGRVEETALGLMEGVLVGASEDRTDGNNEGEAVGTKLGIDDGTGAGRTVITNNGDIEGELDWEKTGARELV